MNLSFERRKFMPIFKWYSLAFLMLALCYYGVILMSGRTLIVMADAAQQHVEVMIYFHKIFWSTLHHLGSGIQMWSWKLGLGSDVLAVFSYYCIGDIFVYPALLVPTKFIPALYCVMIIVRLYCVGLSFAYLAAHFKQFSNKTVVMGSFVYMGSSYVYYASMGQPFFMNPLIQLPLLFLATSYWMNKNRKLPLILMFFWIFVNSFYFAFVLGLGYGIYLLLNLWFKKSDAKNIIRQYVGILVSAITGLLLSAVVLLPSYIAMQGSTRVVLDKYFADQAITYNVAYYLQIPVKFITLSGSGSYWTRLVFAAIAFFAVMFIWIRKKQYPVINAAIIIAFIGMFFPQFAAVFNGFSSPSNRWQLLLSLPLALGACLLVEQARTLKDNELRFINRAAVIYVGYLLIYDIFLHQIDLPSMMFFAITWYCLNQAARGNCVQKIFEKQMMVIVIANVCLAAFITVSPLNKGAVNTMLKFGAFKYDSTEVYSGLDKTLKKSGSYRVNTLANNYTVANGYIFDQAITNKLQNVSAFWSVVSKYDGLFSNAYGNSQYRPNKAIIQVDNRTILDNFLGVKYLFARSKRPNAKKIPAGYKKVAERTNKELGNNTVMYKTSNNLPFLWWSNTYMTYSQNQKLSQSQREYMLVKATTVAPNTRVISGLKQEKTAGKNVVALHYTLVNKKTGKKYTASSFSNLPSGSYRIEIENAKKYKGYELHADLTNISFNQTSFSKRLANIKQNQTQTQKLGSKLKQYQALVWNAGLYQRAFRLSLLTKKGNSGLNQVDSSGLSDYSRRTYAVLNGGYYSGSLPSSATLKLKGTGTFDFKLTVYAVNLGNDYQKAVKTIQQNGLTSIKKKTNQVTATLNHSKAGIVASTIPYSTGWQAYVDGKKVQTYVTNYGFVGFNVPAGKHTIKLVYATPGLKAGAILTVVGVLAMVVVVVIERKRRSEK